MSANDCRDSKVFNGGSLAYQVLFNTQDLLSLYTVKDGRTKPIPRANQQRHRRAAPEEACKLTGCCSGRPDPAVLLAWRVARLGAAGYDR